METKKKLWPRNSGGIKTENEKIQTFTFRFPIVILEKVNSFQKRYHIYHTVIQFFIVKFFLFTEYLKGLE